MTIYCDGIAILEGDFDSHGGGRIGWGLSGNEGDKT